MNDLPNTVIKPHHIRHLISGTIVFLAGIAADLLIVEYRHYAPHTVQWQGGQVEKGYKIHRQTLPPTNVKIEIGFTDDGTLVWRKAVEPKK